ncbi:hypothetical protein H0H87_008387 [Tephrocybe sp. NHM501043]|nr:hypothetical protein H0H87_008387 [Tephrocybe sp. NHM501043]
MDNFATETLVDSDETLFPALNSPSLSDPGLWKQLDACNTNYSSSNEEDANAFWESEDEAIDWNLIEGALGLTPWEQFGEKYEHEAAEIGKISSLLTI